MKEIEIRLDWQDVDLARLQGMLSGRFHGRYAWPLTIFAVLFVAIFGYRLLALRFGPGGTGLVAAGLALIVFAGIARWLNARVRRAIMAAPARRTPSTLVLTVDGIAGSGTLMAGRIPWRHVVDVVDSPKALLVLFSPVEFIPLPDSGLPDGMTRSALRTQIADWRTAAA